MERYQRRSDHEFDLTPGEMLKITGLWTDGWANGVRLTEHNVGSPHYPVSQSQEVKGFPAHCVTVAPDFSAAPL